MMLFKKTVYNKLAAKVNNTDITRFVLQRKYSGLEKKISDADKNIPDTSGLFKKKQTIMVNKTPSISGLATNAALTAVQNKIPDISKLNNRL